MNVRLNSYGENTCATAIGSKCSIAGSLMTQWIKGLATVVAQVQSLTPELPHAIGMAKNKKKVWFLLSRNSQSTYLSQQILQEVMPDFCR